MDDNKNKKRIHITIDELKYKHAKKYAIDHNISFSQLVETAINKMLMLEDERKITKDDLEKMLDSKLSSKISKKDLESALENMIEKLINEGYLNKKVKKD